MKKLYDHTIEHRPADRSVASSDHIDLLRASDIAGEDGGAR